MRQQRPIRHRNFQLRDLGNLLTVVQALETADETAFQVAMKTSDPQAFWKNVARASGFATFQIRGAGALREQHALLWLMPVVTMPHFASVVDRTIAGGLAHEMRGWLRTWFGVGQEVNLVREIRSIDSLSCATPVQLRQLLEMSTKHRAEGEPVFLPLVGGPAVPSALPTLGFVIGSAMRYSAYATMPAPGRPADADLQHRVRAALTFASGNYDATDCDHRVGLPMALGEAVKAGIVMWLQACADQGLLDHWNISLLSPDTTTLDTLWLDQPDRAGGAACLVLRPWQLGEDGLDDLVARIAGLAGAPLPSQAGAGRA